MLAAFLRTLLVGVALLLALPAAAQASRSLYALSTGGVPAANQISLYTIGAGGALSAVTAYPVGDAPRDLAMAPDGRTLYVSFDSVGSGGVHVFPVAGDGSLGASTRVTAGNSSSGIAVSPDGRFLYLGNAVGGTVRTFAIGADGALTPVGGATSTGQSDVADLVVGEDGRHVYATSEWGSVVSTMAVQADGSLASAVSTPVPGFGSPSDMTLVPQFDRLLVRDAISSSAVAFAIDADGALSTGFAVPLGGLASGPVHGGPSPYEDFAFAVGDGVPNDTLKSLFLAVGPVEADSVSLGAQQGIGLGISADASTLYVRTGIAGPPSAGLIRTFSVAADGTLSEQGAGVPVPVTNYLYGGMVVSPEQPPVASFTATPSGTRVTVDASATVDPEGGPVRYDWDFGDGTTIVDGDAVVTHEYAGYGTYEISLVAADEQVCATMRFFTGSTVACNGGAGAQMSRSVTLAPPVPWTPEPAPAPAPAPPAPQPVGPRILPQLDGRGDGDVRATRRGRMTLPSLEAICTTGSGPCDDGEVAINATIRRERVTLGRGTFALADGARGTVALRLSPIGQRLLKRAGSVEAEGIVLLRNAATTAEARRTVTFTLRAPRR